MTGRSEKSFGPQDALSREEMAVMIYRAYQFKTENNAAIEGKSGFIDADSISNWAQLAVAETERLGLVQGRGKQMFMPHEKVTRAESAQVISLLVELSNNATANGQTGGI